MLYHHLCNCQTVRHQKLQSVARLQSDGSNTSGLGWSSARLLLPVLRPQATNEPWLISRFISSCGLEGTQLCCVFHTALDPCRPLTLFWIESGQALLTSGAFPVVWLQASISHRLHQPSASSPGSPRPLYAGSFGAVYLQIIYHRLTGHNT